LLNIRMLIQHINCI